ncbi:MAG: DNA polymerase III subunit beta [Deltaproteobacteria bacterium RIFOXYA12_FULL_58_15]|nr:MAG: DNA polymerase III subunit beta [Deltaproteobacteria bacterium RIFOXYA12_FULL_58_15]OGR07113.1 MAG: DNA polymerase III subunit beta [Deltaproteobacteria bacterium RIFOXYB12_FULL_58_9]
MKMTIETAELSRALYRVQGIADRKSTMPILAHVLLEAADSGLTVSATDLDVGLSGIYKAEVSDPGSVAIHARQLYDVVKSLPTKTLEIMREDNNWINIKAGASRFRLVGMAADEFPTLPSYAQVKTFSIPSKDLADMIDRTLFCVSTDDNRHNLGGIFCEAPETKMLRMVATDGHRLALCERRFEEEIPIDQGVIVPRKGFQELKRVLSDTSESIDKVELGFSGNSGVLRAGSVVLSTRLVEGQFPDYEQVIPKSASKSAKISRTAFAEALRRVSLLSQSRSYGVRIGFSPGKMELLAEDPEFGEARETIDIDYQGEELHVGFNARYLLDVLALTNDDGVVLDFSDDLSPGVIKPLEDTGFLAVVMPMRI